MNLLLSFVHIYFRHSVLRFAILEHETNRIKILLKRITYICKHSELILCGNTEMNTRKNMKQNKKNVTSNITSKKEINFMRKEPNMKIILVVGRCRMNFTHINKSRPIDGKTFKSSHNMDAQLL